MEEEYLRARLHAAVARAYGDPTAPRFDFVSHALSRPFPYASLLQALTSAGFRMVDTTDANDDVAWHLGLRRGADEVDVAVSMVGPFAHAAPPVSSQQGAEALRDELVRIFRLAGLLAIPDAMLAEPTAMVDNGNTLNLGQALFAANGNH